MSKLWRYPELEKAGFGCVEQEIVFLFGLFLQFCFAAALCPDSWAAKLQGCFVTRAEIRGSGSCSYCLALGRPQSLEILQFFILSSFAFFTYTLIHSFLLVGKRLVAWQSKVAPFSLGWLLCSLTLTLFTCKNSLL